MNTWAAFLKTWNKTCLLFFFCESRYEGFKVEVLTHLLKFTEVTKVRISWKFTSKGSVLGKVHFHLNSVQIQNLRFMTWHNSLITFHFPIYKSKRGFVFVHWTQQEAGSTRLTLCLPSKGSQSKHVHGQQENVTQTLERRKGDWIYWQKHKDRSEESMEVWLLRNTNYICVIQTSQQVRVRVRCESRFCSLSACLASGELGLKRLWVTVCLLWQ